MLFSMNCFSGLLCSIRDCAERDGLHRACQLFDKMLNRAGVPTNRFRSSVPRVGPSDARLEFTLLSTIVRPRSLTGALLPWQVRYCVECMFLDSRLDLLRVGMRRT
ncbi:hypothetical protein NL676_009905 [Syzygium grande]|nr:hypothetical protein NL676_009905 [Syzygium grande]